MMQYTYRYWIYMRYDAIYVQVLDLHMYHQSNIPLHMGPMPWLQNLVRLGCVYTGFLSFLYLSPY